MSLNRELLRKKAKMVYKEKVKGVPKSKRISFNSFFKEYKKAKLAEKDMNSNNNEDFNFDDLVNINEIDDEDLQVSE